MPLIDVADIPSRTSKAGVRVARPHQARLERFGFRYHSERRVGPYRVARYEYRV